jgi:hypothetical protein
LGDEVRSGGVVIRQFDDLDAVSKFDASDDFRQLVSPFQSAAALTSSNTINLAVVADKALFVSTVR